MLWILSLRDCSRESGWVHPQTCPWTSVDYMQEMGKAESCAACSKSLQMGRVPERPSDPAARLGTSSTLAARSCSPSHSESLLQPRMCHCCCDNLLLCWEWCLCGGSQGAGFDPVHLLGSQPLCLPCLGLQKALTISSHAEQHPWVLTVTLALC